MSLLRRDAAPWIVAVICAFVVAGLGGIATDIGPWYFQLRKPAWQPPDWLFGPVWTIIFALSAVAAAMCWITAPSARARLLTLWLFLINGVFNVLWSVLFFSMRRPDWALIQVVFLWLSVLALIIVLGRFFPPVRWMLAPYLAWVAFAAALNTSIVQLNAPFG
jgi:translocator protein